MVTEISVVIPAYNEAENIEKAVEGVFAVMERLFPKYEVIVIDDGSNDGTPSLLGKLSREFNKLKIIRFENNSGYGVALREGFKAASHRYIFYTDSDGQYDIGEIEYILPLMGQCDIVAGFRLKRNDHVIRRISSAAYNLFVSFYLRINVRDVNCSFKLFSREVIERIVLHSRGFSIDAELLWKADRAGFKICEAGVGHYKREKGISKVKVKDVIDTVKEIIYFKKDWV
jgi:glycosyltransferase involved in cell wall biosynthesis